MSSSDESEHSVDEAVITGSELNYRDLMFARHWYNLGLSKRAWEPLLKHVRPMRPGLSNFCRAHGFSYKDKETLREFQRKNGKRETGHVRRCMGISVLRGTQCRYYRLRHTNPNQKSWTKFH